MGPLCYLLRGAGYDHQISTTAVGSNHPICVLSKTPITTVPSENPLLRDSGLWLEINVQEHRFSFGVVHVPTKTRPAMKAFLSALVEIASINIDDPLLLIGDFNTGIGPADGPLNNFGDVDRFVALQGTGFSDAWRHIHGDKIEHTWCRGAKSYRIDHALTSPALASRIRDCRYSHLERDSGASDHSALLVEIED